MPVPYRKTPRAAQEGVAAFLDVIWLHSERTFYGALLLIDGRGQPLEFVQNSLIAPGGFLWPEVSVQARGIAALSHSLFDACAREPDLLLAPSTLGTPEFCRQELGSAIPFALIKPAQESRPMEWIWVNEPPGPGMRAHLLYEALTRRGFVTEPFERLRKGLRELYPAAPWKEIREAKEGKKTKESSYAPHKE